MIEGLFTWYLLYGGSSTDGRGQAVYMGRTQLSNRAYTFYCENIENNPYSTGKVVIVTDTMMKHATIEDFHQPHITI